MRGCICGAQDSSAPSKGHEQSDEEAWLAWENLRFSESPEYAESDRWLVIELESPCCERSGNGPTNDGAWRGVPVPELSTPANDCT